MEFCQEVTLLFVFFINIFCVGFLFEPLINQNKIYSGIKRCEFEKFEILNDLLNDSTESQKCDSVAKSGLDFSAISLKYLFFH